MRKAETDHMHAGDGGGGGRHKGGSNYKRGIKARGKKRVSVCVATQKGTPVSLPLIGPRPLVSVSLSLGLPRFLSVPLSLSLSLSSSATPFVAPTAAFTSVTAFLVFRSRSPLPFAVSPGDPPRPLDPSSSLRRELTSRP